MKSILKNKSRVLCFSAGFIALQLCFGDSSYGAESAAAPETAEIFLNHEEAIKLAEAPNAYVPAEVEHKGKRQRAELKLKNPGSGVQEKEPSFVVRIPSLSGNGHEPTDELTLEQSSRDPSHLKRFAAAWLARKMDVACPKVEHLKVKLNGRSLGIYTLTSRASKGGSSDFHDLEEWLIACGATPKSSEAVPTAKFSECVDQTNFCRFLAWEAFTVHSDGYLHTGSNAVVASKDTKHGIVVSGDLGSFHFFPRSAVLRVSKGKWATQVLRDIKSRREFVKALVEVCAPEIEKSLLADLNIEAEKLRPNFFSKLDALRFQSEYGRLQNRLTQRFAHVRNEAKRLAELPDKELAALELPQVTFEIQGRSNPEENTAFAFDAYRETWRAAVKGNGKLVSSVPFRVREIEIIEEKRGALKGLNYKSTEYCQVDAICDGKRFGNVGLRLRGRSTRESFEGRPGFTLKFNSTQKDQRLDGNPKLHFKRTPFDGAYLNDFLTAWLFTKSGMAAPRVDFAHLTVNGEDYGLYVTVEGTTKPFLQRSFGEDNGLLFEGEMGDIDRTLDLDSGVLPSGYEGLRNLTKAANESLAQGKLDALKELMDPSELARFVALEVALGHNDGYSMAKHNYRLYHESKSGRFRFLPHGSDNLRIRAREGTIPDMRGVLAQALIGSAEGQRLYYRELNAIIEEKLDAPQLVNDTAAVCRELQRVLRKSEPLKAARQLELSERLLSRLLAKREAISHQVKATLTTKLSSNSSLTSQARQ